MDNLLTCGYAAAREGLGLCWAGGRGLRRVGAISRYAAADAYVQTVPAFGTVPSSR